MTESALTIPSGVLGGRSRVRLIAQGFAALGAATIVLLLLELAIGPVRVALSAVADVVLGRATENPAWSTILLTLRLPRVLTAALAGAALGAAGLLMQTLFRNPLADPWFLGIVGGARAGVASLHGRRFPWGDETPPRRRGQPLANGPDERTHRLYPSWEVFSSYDDGYAELAPVASFPPNAYGLFDMAGSAYEWVSDFYQKDYYAVGPAVDPEGPLKSEGRVVRGGGWGYSPSHLRASFRGVFEAEGFWTATVGFRCVLEEK
jgi:hypothetical protein